MVDYTTKDSGGSGIGLYLAAGAILVVLLYAIFAGGSPAEVDPATLTAPADGGAAITDDAVEPAPVITE